MDKNKQVWFVTGSQHLYGDEALRCVESDSKEIAEYLNKKAKCSIVFKPVVTTSDNILKLMKEANACDECIGIITWMHTFSPSKMWIAGLGILQKPVLHLHTQYNEKLPYSTIDMDFMNLNQSAHGDREHGFIYARLRKQRKVVVGYWKDEDVISQINVWIQAAIGYDVSKKLKVCRFGDNMRDVAVTEGNKVSAQIKLGWTVDYYGIGDLVEEIDKVTENEVENIFNEYQNKYDIITENIDSVKEQAKYEIALERFMKNIGADALTTNFEDLHGLKQLPGLSIQRLMEKGYGFGGEGDWKTAAMTKILKAMSDNEATSFMEDYTYNLEKGNEMILGAHMLEVCPTVADGKIKIDVQPLGIGNKQPPARMIFDGKSGSAVAVSLIDLGDRFRMIVAEVEAVKTPEKMPNLPVAGVLWKPMPNFYDGVRAWILAGGAHHTVLSFSLTKEHIIDLSRMFNIECVVIDEKINIDEFETKLMIGDMIWK